MESLFSSLRSLLAVALQIKAHRSVIVPVLVLQRVVFTTQYQDRHEKCILEQPSDVD